MRGPISRWSGWHVKGQRPLRAVRFGLSTGQTLGFWDWVPGIASKHKILWFGVDMPHRQRYFFICGCEWKMNRHEAYEGQRSLMNAGKPLTTHISIAA